MPRFDRDMATAAGCGLLLAGLIAYAQNLERIATFVAHLLGA
jgi:hypothetical protein